MDHDGRKGRKLNFAGPVTYWKYVPVAVYGGAVWAAAGEFFPNWWRRAWLNECQTRFLRVEGTRESGPPPGEFAWGRRRMARKMHFSFFAPKTLVVNLASALSSAAELPQELAGISMLLASGSGHSRPEPPPTRSLTRGEGRKEGEDGLTN